MLSQDADVDIMAIAVEAEQLEHIDVIYPIGMNPFRMIVPLFQLRKRRVDSLLSFGLSNHWYNKCVPIFVSIDFILRNDYNY